MHTGGNNICAHTAQRLQMFNICDHTAQQAVITFVTILHKGKSQVENETFHSPLLAGSTKTTFFTYVKNLGQIKTMSNLPQKSEMNLIKG